MMRGIDPAEIQRHLQNARTAPDTDAQGKAYEALALHLFDAVPGCFAEHNGVSYFDTEQIDVGVCNGKHQDGFHALPHVILIECKNWSRPVDSSTLGYFVNILANRSVECGILIAANGITGDAHDHTNAHALGIGAIARGIKVLIITTEDIEKLTCTSDFVELILRRFLTAYMRGGVGAP
ncbi:restriction endonuclease [Nocardia sp. NPDC020380]|uniref:restriction endonuclease n=1 Tax=Nocardia sp. NPDC020380 TaxID=3364309 RepID=UPI003792F863